jgi:hypothetical protein
MNRTDDPAGFNLESTEGRDSRLDIVVTAYLESCERGQPPMAEEWINRHPELAPDLADFLASLAEVDKAFAPLRSTLHGCSLRGPDGR